jgi:hypothetical protein
MSQVKQIVLDVLKPHSPNVLELARTLADAGQDYDVCIDVTGVDEKTETVLIEITGNHIDYETIDKAITSLGGSVHSIDRVEVQGDSGSGTSG